MGPGWGNRGGSAGGAGVVIRLIGGQAEPRGRRVRAARGVSTKPGGGIGRARGDGGYVGTPSVLRTSKVPRKEFRLGASILIATLSLVR